MNRKEREKLDLATGKIRLSEKEIKRREEKEAQQRKAKKDRILIGLSSLLALALLISGIVWFHARQQSIAKENEGFPSQVPMPTAKEINEMENELIVLETSLGDIKIELNPMAAPRTSRHIRQLVKEGFYDGVLFHRVISDFMIQTGGETQEKPVDPGFQFRDEINPLAPGIDLPDEMIRENEANGYNYNFSLPSIALDYGVLAMANAGANTNSSQFFIITKKDGTDWLNGLHTGFGKVVEGMEVAEQIQKVATGENDRPIDPVIIQKAYIVPKQG